MYYNFLRHRLVLFLSKESATYEVVLKIKYSWSLIQKYVAHSIS
jgi:hypothetical protein